MKQTIIIIALIALLTISFSLAIPPEPPSIPQTTPEGTEWEEMQEETTQAPSYSTTTQSEQTTINDSGSTQTQNTEQETTQNIEQNIEQKSEQETEILETETIQEKEIERTEAPQEFSENKNITKQIIISITILIITIMTITIIHVKRHKNKKNTNEQETQIKKETKTPEEQAKEYIEIMRKKGQGEEIIKNNLLSVGWNKNIVEQLMKK